MTRCVKPTTHDAGIEAAVVAIFASMLVLLAVPTSRAGTAPGSDAVTTRNSGVQLSSALAPMFDPANDELLSRVVVPSPARRVGEVRLVRRGDADVVQTLLASKVLARVVSEIRKKEIANWPPDHADYADAVRYLAALDEGRSRLWREVPTNDRRADRRQKMLIEFVLGPDRAAVLVGGFEMDERGDAPRVTERRPLVVFQPSRGYAERNMRLIVADSFHAEGPALDALLRPFTHLGTHGE